ncbi:MAG: lysylphosphatidylglycerol synthase transmembrane domain-containing protein [Planctomycetota bacterium]
MRHGLLYTLLIFIAIVIVVVIFAWVGVDKIIEKFREIGPLGFILYFAVAVAGLMVTVVGWYLILRSHNIKIKFLHAAIGQLIGNAIGFITPSLYLGGEPVKAHYVGTIYGISKTKVFSTAIFGKFQELTCLLLFIYAGTLVMILEAKEVHLPMWMWSTLLTVDIVLGIIVIMTLISIAKNSPVFSHIAAWIARRGILTKKIEKLIPKIINIEELIYQAFRHDWKAGMVAFFFNFLSIIAVVIKPVIFFYFLYHQNIFSLTEIAVIFTFSQILLVFHVTPGAIGVYEGGQIVIFKIVGIGADDALSYLVICRFVDLVLTGGGFYLAIHYNLVKFISPKIETLPAPGNNENYPPAPCNCPENADGKAEKDSTLKENSSPAGILPK